MEDGDSGAFGSALSAPEKGPLGDSNFPLAVAVQQPDSKPNLVQRVLEIASAFFFMGMVVSLLMGIYWRYVLKDPLAWTLDIAMVCFIWAVMLGAPLSDWEDSHLQFDLVYNKMPESVQLGMRIFGNLLLIGTFAAVTPASFRYLDSVAGRPVLGVSWLSLRAVFLSFVVFLVITIIQRTFLLVSDGRQLLARAARGRGEA